PMLQ
ncbi:uvrD-like helicase C-terminal domain protein, partial [Chlamydia psittaci 01DC11]